MINGAEIMAQCLQTEGVEVVFGYPGAAICPFYDALYSRGIRHVLVRSEQNSAHAASGYSRSGGKIGVCVATSGPGATNLITGIAAAYMDSVPLIAITGQVSLFELGKDVFQEADVTGACESFVKHSYLVKAVEDLPRIFKEAFHIASTGRPGPVLIDVPFDIQTQQLNNFSYPEKAIIPGYKPKTRGHGLQIKKAVEAIEASTKPLICCGGGIISARGENTFRDFVHHSRIPVVSTMMGLGVMDFDDPLYLGMLGSFGTYAAGAAAKNCDLLILCGARVADRAFQMPHVIKAKIIHIDIDPAEIGKNIKADIPIVGDAQFVLEVLTKRLPKMENKSDWAYSYIQTKKLPLPRLDFVDPLVFMQDLWQQVNEEIILTADVGQNLIWSANSFKRGKFLTSGGLGCMGYALPAALGAKLANPKANIIAICGDGSFQMSMCELATAVGENIPLKLILLDNRRLGMVRELQNQSFGGRHMATHMGGNPDFVKLIASYGIKTCYASNNMDAQNGLSEILAYQGAAVLVCKVDPNTPSIY